MIKVPYISLPHAEGLDLPHYATDGAVGLDLSAALVSNEVKIISHGERALIPTGIIFQIPDGFEGQIRPRSGLALKHGVTVLNTPGTIDSDYRGEIFILLVNLGKEDFTLTRGMRIAQIVFAPLTRVSLVEASTLIKTTRGSEGFGSTGF
jgi:dUTP pyrophosphatase